MSCRDDRVVLECFGPHIDGGLSVRFSPAAARQVAATLHKGVALAAKWASDTRDDPRPRVEANPFLHADDALVPLGVVRVLVWADWVELRHLEGLATRGVSFTLGQAESLVRELLASASTAESFATFMETAQILGTWTPDMGEVRALCLWAEEVAVRGWCPNQYT